jgi:hypothetical protein
MIDDFSSFREHEETPVVRDEDEESSFMEVVRNHSQMSHNSMYR